MDGEFLHAARNDMPHLRLYNAYVIFGWFV